MIAAGRAISLVVDGMPNPLLVVYLALEIGFGVVGVMLAKSQPATAEARPGS